MFAYFALPNAVVAITDNATTKDNQYAYPRPSHPIRSSARRPR
jgi:hypothetical protein